MADLLTIEEIEQQLRDAVVAAGGASKWCKKNGVSMQHALHMVSNGSAASLPHVLDKLGFERVTRFKRI
jgi:hypothetical protein